MIDFEQEIEVRLAQFDYLNGKGNVKDCNKTLYEILRLMLGMMTQQEAEVEPPMTVTLSEEIEEEIVEQIVEQIITADIAGEHKAITSDELTIPTPPVAKPRHAPHGLTANGNPRRIRPKRTKR